MVFYPTFRGNLFTPLICHSAPPVHMHKAVYMSPLETNGSLSAALSYTTVK